MKRNTEAIRFIKTLKEDYDDGDKDNESYVELCDHIIGELERVEELEDEARDYKDKYQQCCTQFYKLKSMALGALGGVAASAYDSRGFLDKLEDAIFG